MDNNQESSLIELNEKGLPSQSHADRLAEYQRKELLRKEFLDFINKNDNSSNTLGINENNIMFYTMEKYNKGTFAEPTTKGLLTGFAKQAAFVGLGVGAFFAGTGFESLSNNPNGMYQLAMTMMGVGVLSMGKFTLDMEIEKRSVEILSDNLLQKKIQSLTKDPEFIKKYEEIINDKENNINYYVNVSEELKEEKFFMKKAKADLQATKEKVVDIVKSMRKGIENKLTNNSELKV